MGGYKAKQGSWPWQGNMQILNDHNSDFQCGVVLLSEEWALTAAHCISGKYGLSNDSNTPWYAHAYRIDYLTTIFTQGRNVVDIW